MARCIPVWSLLVASAMSAPSAVPAQDTRVVTEPKRPVSCVTLRAALTSIGDSTLADGDERRSDTERIQRAIDGCASGGGKTVVLARDPAAPHSAFVSGPIHLRAGVTLVVDTGAVLFASRNARDYDLRPGSCGVVDDRGHGCKPLITVDRAPHAAIMGPGTIDGRGWAKLAGRDSSWWDLAQYAKVKNLFQSCPRLVVASQSDDFTLYRIRLRHSPNFHVVYEKGNGFTAWGVVIDTPQPNARNTDGIDPSTSKNVTITRSFINTGDDNVAIKAGGPGPTTNITVSHNHFYRGHGVSIGSETNGGAGAILVEDLSIDGADNGLRIKSNASRGGVVQNVVYRDVCIRNTKHPIEMDTHYSASPKTTGDLIPQYRDVKLENIRVLDAGLVILEGYDAARPLGLTFDNVIFDTPDAIKVRSSFADVKVGPGRTNLPVSDGVRLTGMGSDAPSNSCTGKFVPMPKSAAQAALPQGAGANGLAAIVDARFTGRDSALVDNVPTFHTLGAALAGMPVNGVGRAVILIRDGRYHEKLTVERPFITLRGESRDSTIITYDAASGTPTGQGGTFGTRGSYTLRIAAPDVRVENLTIENAFDYTGNAAKAADDRTKVRDGQGVALMTDLDSDRAVFVNVRITGHQDTLFPNAGRSYFSKCEITGNVDFIFGAGRVVFDDCDIVSLDRGSANNNGYVTAPSTPVSQPYGFLFIHSRLKKEKPTMAANSVTLGRPWHPYANPRINSAVAFIDCWMDDHIGDKGWDRMSSVDSTGTRVWFEPADQRFFEYGTKGPGAIASGTRKVLGAEQAKQYTPANVLDGWVPEISVVRR